VAGSIIICSYRPEQSGRGAPTRYDSSPPSRAADETARGLCDQLPDVVLVKSWRSLSSGHLGRRLAGDLAAIVTEHKLPRLMCRRLVYTAQK
jgi:hypothetical protein